MASVRRVFTISGDAHGSQTLEQLIALVAAAMVLTPIARRRWWMSPSVHLRINTVMGVRQLGPGAVRHTAEKHPDFPAFLRVDVAKRTVSDGSAGRTRTSEIAR